MESTVFADEELDESPDEEPMERKKDLPYGYKMGRDVGEKVFEDMCHELGIDEHEFKETDEGEDAKNKLVHAFCTGCLEFENSVFTLNLKTPIQAGKKEISVLTIPEPDGAQLRSMSMIKKKNDDFGKALAVLADVTRLGMPVMNRMKSRDSMIAVAVISLFL